MSENIAMTPEARWKHLVKFGRQEPIDISSNETIDMKPDWFDEKRWLQGKATIDKFFVGIAYSSFTGLLLILQLPEGLEPLLSTGNSKDIPSLFNRYLNTVIHVTSWYEDDIFNPETKGYKSIRQVRSMHRRVQKLMNEKYKVPSLDSKQRYWYNHYDVTLTQFAFIGLAMIYPDKSGMIAATNEEMEAVNYYWRVLGWFMGVKDEFNLCQFDRYEDIKEFNRLIFEHEFKANFDKYPCDKGLEMTKAICIALHHYVPLITFNSLAVWWRDCFKFNGYKSRPMTIKEKMLNFATGISFNHLLKNERFLKFSSKLHKKRFESRLKEREKVYKSLCKKYKNSDEFTFYSDRVDIFNKSLETEFIDNIESTIDELDKGDNESGKLANGKLSTVCPFGFVSPIKKEQQQQKLILTAT